VLAAGQASSSSTGGHAPPPPTSEKKDFVNPNPGGLLKPPAATAPNFSKLLGNGSATITEPKELPPDQAPKLMTNAAKQCSIPLKWAKIQKGTPDPRSEKWIGPHPNKIDPIYAAPPAPVCVDAENKPPVKPEKPSN
jgi:hypothetical protein